MAEGRGRDGEQGTLGIFFDRVSARTEDPLHARLLCAAKRKDPQAALEKELKKAFQEILDED